MTEPLILEQIPVQEGDLLASLAEISGLSRTALKRAASRGALWLNSGAHHRRIRRFTGKFSADDTLSLFYDPDLLAMEPPQPTCHFDGDSFSVWYKPVGLLSSGSRFADHFAIDRWIETRQERATFLVHRLDRIANGLMVLAHDRKTAASLSEQFRNRQVTKVYRAVADGNINADVTLAEALDDKPSVSHIHVVTTDSQKQLTLLDVQIDTGRRHQIRRHLAGCGHPLSGDHLYGSETSYEPVLTAWQLAFAHPQTAEPLQFSISPPDFTALVIRPAAAL
ncbi:MAG: RNA pseudouridine synthase [Pseudomonadales bacterium]|nr:RNA pseudouridine synthase [Pseudomonadales bacterium]